MLNMILRRTRVQLSLRGKITLLACGIALAASLAVSLINVSRDGDLAMAQATQALEAEAQLVAARLEAGFRDMADDARIVEQTPPIQGIIRTLNNGGIDPDDGSSMALWRSRLATIFESIMASRLAYTQIRYIGLDDDGRELVRVNRTDAGLTVVDDFSLQTKADRPYFQLGSRLPKGEVGFSLVDENVEFGEPDGSGVPMIRIVMPVFDAAGKRFGMIVINADYARLLDASLARAAPPHDVFVFSPGDDLFHYNPDTNSTEFEFGVFGGSKTLTAIRALVSDDRRSIVDDAMIARVKQPIVHFGSGLSLEIFVRADRAEFLAAQSAKYGWSFLTSLGLTVFAVAGVAVIARKLTAPLKSMTDSLRQHREVGAVLQLPSDSPDEIGELARAFSELVADLEESETKVRTIIEGAIDAMIVIDERGRIDTFNPACERIFGYRAEEVLGKNVSMLMSEEDSTRHDQYLSNYLETGTRKIIGIGREVRARRQNGELFPADLSISQIEVNGRKLFCGTIRDISQQKADQSALADSEQRLSLALDGGGLGLWDWDVTGNKYTVSDRYAEMLGYTKSELPQHEATWRNLVHPEDLQKTSKQLDLLVAGKVQVSTSEFRMRHKNGSWRWVVSTGRIFERNADQTAARIVGTHLDITERKQGELALEDRNRHLELAEQVADLGHWRVNLETREVFWSEGVYKIHGLDCKRYVPTLEAAFDFYHPEDRQQVRDLIAQALEAGQAFDFDLRIIRADGEVRFVRSKGEYLESDIESERAIFGTFQDITEQKMVERMKNEFVSTVNHELRTPLTSIYGSLDLLRRKAGDQLDAKSLRLVELAHEGCERLANLINDILDQEKIAAGKMDYMIETVDLARLVQDTVNRHEGLAARYDISFETRIEVDDVAVRVDSGRFSQALLNLLSNAAKYSPKGEVVTIDVVCPDRNSVRVSVSDRGPGISETFQSRIFERFSQADSTTTRKVTGTGLGLNITKSIIEAFGGTVSFDTARGVGTTFHFVLPVDHMWGADAEAVMAI